MLLLNFADCEYFLESNSPDNLALCETNLDNSIDSLIGQVNCAIKNWKKLEREEWYIPWVLISL